MKKNRLSMRAFSITFAMLLLQAISWSSLYAQEIKPLGVVIWDGEIVIYRHGSAEYEEEKSGGGQNFSHREKHVIDDITTIYACGSKEHLHVYCAERKLEDIFEKSTNSTADSTNCGIPEELIKKYGPMYATIHFDPVIKRPGNTSFLSERMHTEIDEGEDVFPLKERTRVTLMIMGGDSYLLDVQSLATVHILQDHIYESYNACTGKTKRSEGYVLPGGEGEPPSFSTNVTDLDWEGTRVTRYKFPLLMLPAGFHGEGEASGSILEGTVEIIERGNKVKVKGGYDVTTESTWRFEAKDPCKEVYDQLMEDIAWAEAYLDADIHEKVKNIKDPEERMKTYHKLVNQHTFRSMHGREPPEGELADTDAEVGGGSLEKWLKALKKKLADQCKHDIIYKSIEKHEKEHLKQADKFKSEWNSGNAAIYGLMEVTAHLIGIHVLLNWLEFNCPETSLVEAKGRIQRIEKTHFTRN